MAESGTASADAMAAPDASSVGDMLTPELPVVSQIKRVASLDSFSGGDESELELSPPAVRRSASTDALAVDESAGGAIPSIFQCDKEGYLFRKHDVAADGKKSANRVWFKYYVALSGSHLFFFRDHNEPLQSKSHMLKMSVHGSISDIAFNYKKKKHVFRLRMPSGDEYLFQASDHSDMVEWIRRVQSAAAAGGDGTSDDAALDLIRRKAVQARESSPSPRASPMSQRRTLGRSTRDKEKHLTVDVAESSGTDAPRSPSSPDTHGRRTHHQWQHGAQRAALMRRVGSLFKRQASGSAPEPVFGVSLEEHLDGRGRAVPLIVEQCIAEVERRGLDTIGIYRLSGNSAAVQALKEEYNSADPAAGVNLTDERWDDVHTITGALKLYFRELPDPLVPRAMYADFVAAVRISEYEERLYSLKDLVRALPPAHGATLKFLIGHLRRVADRSEENKMATNNLAIVFGPTLARPPAEDTMALLSDMAHQCTMVDAMIASFDWMFADDVPPEDGAAAGGDGAAAQPGDGTVGATTDALNLSGSAGATRSRPVSTASTSSSAQTQSPAPSRPISLVAGADGAHLNSEEHRTRHLSMTLAMPGNASRPHSASFSVGEGSTGSSVISETQSPSRPRSTLGAQPSSSSASRPSSMHTTSRPVSTVTDQGTSASAETGTQPPSASRPSSMRTTSRPVSTVADQGSSPSAETLDATVAPSASTDGEASVVAAADGTVASVGFATIEATQTANESASAVPEAVGGGVVVGGGAGEPVGEGAGGEGTDASADDYGLVGIPMTAV